MHLKSIVNLLVAASLIVIGLTACATDREEGRESEQHPAALESQAKIARAEAEKTALTQAPGGTVKSAELEQEHGKLVWSFDIATAGSENITEVLVDAVAGSILSVEKESPAQQAKEVQEDQAKAHAKSGNPDRD